MKYVLVALFLFTACQSRTVIKPQEVDVAVAVGCQVVTPATPTYNTPGKASAPLPEQVAALAADLDLAQGYAGALGAALKGCQEVPGDPVK